ncbi:hypothetical protein K402DRAFT_326005, partial [Aulographum hederae CBS 113979]
ERTASKDADEPENFLRSVKGDRRDYDAESVHVPASVPYTTAASEFLYGKSVTIAALAAKKRKLYNLYLHPRAEKLPGGERDTVETVVEHARAANVKVTRVDDSWLRIMDTMSGKRPHNGCILEASPLPVHPVVELSKMSPQTNTISFQLQPQSLEELAVNGTDTSIEYSPTFAALRSQKFPLYRHPFVLLLDDILDPGNLGAIIRSAYFLGIDAVIVCKNTCAPLTSTALKASAGAAEKMSVLMTNTATDFLDKSIVNGWNVFAAVAPSETEENVEPRLTPLQSAPTILMVGGEGQGLRTYLKKRAQYFVGIRGARSVEEIGVDSLNVSVAAAVLAAEFMRPPTQSDSDAEVVDAGKKFNKSKPAVEVAETSGGFDVTLSPA